MSISELSKAWANHNRKFASFGFVYPVISRRAKGLSIGVNCTPNGGCSFNCVYCQAGTVAARLTPCSTPAIDEIIFELKEILSIYRQTKLAGHFAGIPEENRILRDIALSGDGEPTLYPGFAELCEALKEIQNKMPETKLVLITNATQICEENKKAVRGIEFLTSQNGEIWGKLDAGTDECLQFINRPAKKTNIAKIEDNLRFIVSKFPLRIQTMLCEYSGKAPSEQELECYSQIVKRIYEANPQNLLSVQLYSVARQVMDNSVKQLSKDFLHNVQEKIKEKVSNLTVEVF
ncbi:MAG: radical SAM protein [Fibromonadaceae bacterium]|jgi:wyosine [tRNA(Phe)-imidazoG37] synthetase (radical SAM superfamily)|nr:radical SAM protein [Fibromonadaceae bacterium]